MDNNKITVRITGQHTDEFTGDMGVRQLKM